MKKIISIILSLAMLLSFAACTAPKVEPEQTSKEQSYVLRKNNITIEQKYEGEPNEWGGYNSSYLEISGLKNKEVETNINARIKSEYDVLSSWEHYPNYRGLYYDLEKIKDLDPYYESVYVSEYCNVGNVLSVVFDAQKSYERVDSQGYYDNVFFNIRKPINFNLNTGEELKITDVFMPGFDGIKYINDIINGIINNSESFEEDFYYDDGWDAIKVVGTFPGISEDQAFYISSYGETLYLVLDDKTPWVYLNSNYPQYVSIDISNVSALDGKYIKENIYEDESENLILVPTSYDEASMVRDYKFEDHFLGRENCYYDETICYYEEMPEYQIKLMKDFVAEQQVAMETFADTYLTGNMEGNFSVSTGIYRVGKFTNINLYHYFSAYPAYSYYYDWSEDGPGHVEYESKEIVFKDGKEEPLVIEDLFIPGYDFSTWEFDPHSYSFDISTDSIYFRGGDEFFSKSFQEIGCENLTIFE